MCSGWGAKETGFVVGPSPLCVWGRAAGLKNVNMTLRLYLLRIYTIGVDLAERKTGSASTVTAGRQNTIDVSGTW